jgi:hypothetical protein
LYTPAEQSRLASLHAAHTWACVGVGVRVCVEGGAAGEMMTHKHTHVKQ